MKKLIILSMGKSTGEETARQIRRLLGQYIKVETLLLSQLSQPSIEGDLLLFTSEFIAKIALEHFKGVIPYLVANRVINHKNIKDVISIPAGTEVLLVNDGKESALEAIQQLIDIGLDHIKYYPFYPGVANYPKLQLAITPGETHLKPDCVTNIIDIGSRILDIPTIHEIASKLGIEEVLKNSLVTEYIRDIVEISRSIDISRKSALESEKILEIILNSVENGITLIDNFGIILRVNSKFESIFAKKQEDLIGKKFLELINEPEGVLEDNKSWIKQIKSREILIEIRKLQLDGNLGYLVTLNYTDKISKLGYKIKKTYQGKFNRRLYTFEDYLSINGQVKEILRKAEKFAKTDATILIQGENGTGKEILAQAIHMSSYRRKNPFIPINITAISPNLLESELFGYEEGAFTGALKGGKIGLFEIASGGTVFIDEVGDAPLNFQVKLLRVLEEKTIRRVGGVDEIPVDVRIIAATNKNLLDLVEKNRFREDLFFRLNILPLKTIPLRDRKDDIRYLLKHFIQSKFGDKRLKVEDILDDKALTILDNYRWRGNVRELINLVEYLFLIYEGETLDYSCLHPYMLEDKNEEEKIILDANELWVLKTIGDINCEGIGRTTIAQIAEKQGKGIGEGKIRAIVKKLEGMGLIKSLENKKGSVITKKGKNVLTYYREMDKFNQQLV